MMPDYRKAAWMFTAGYCIGVFVLVGLAIDLVVSTLGVVAACVLAFAINVAAVFVCRELFPSPPDGDDCGDCGEHGGDR